MSTMGLDKTPVHTEPPEDRFFPTSPWPSTVQCHRSVNLLCCGKMSCNPAAVFQSLMLEPSLLQVVNGLCLWWWFVSLQNEILLLLRSHEASSPVLWWKALLSCVVMLRPPLDTFCNTLPSPGRLFSEPFNPHGLRICGAACHLDDALLSPCSTLHCFHLCGHCSVQSYGRRATVGSHRPPIHAAMRSPNFRVCGACESGFVLYILFTSIR